MSKKQTRSRNGSSLPEDNTTEWAKLVAAGKVIAGPHVRAACARHLRDLKEGHARGLRFDVELAERAISFFPQVLRLAGGGFEGSPFTLLGWQMFIVGSLFGWVFADDGARRFRIAYIETGKGSGKSPLVAGVGLYGLVADGEPRAEIYAAATKKDQAMILFRDAVAAVKQSPILKRKLRMLGGTGHEWNIADHSSGSFFRPISSDDGQSGPRVHMGLVDEVHEHKTPTMVEMLRAGTKKRRQALIILITNSGADKETICWHYHDYGAKVADNVLQDDSLFAFICSCDADEDPIKSEDSWPKTNPSLVEADLPGLRYLREQVTAARGMPAKESIVRRLNFCQWTDALAPWIGREAWMKARQEFDLKSLHGRRCYGGLDLGSTLDMTAFVLLFEPEEYGKPWALWAWYWTPADTVFEREDRDHVPYSVWINDGSLETTPGRAVSRLFVLQRIRQICDTFEPEAVGYDRWRIEDLQALAADEDIELPKMVAHGQGSKDMSPAIDEFESMFANGILVHNGNPVLTWNAASVTLEVGPAGDRKPTKRRSTGRIDGIVAALMAIGVSMKEQHASGSVYEDLAKARRT